MLAAQCVLIPKWPCKPRGVVFLSIVRQPLVAAY